MRAGKEEEVSEEDDLKTLAPGKRWVPTSDKPYKCTTPGCNAAYRQSNGLKYHRAVGKCFNRYGDDGSLARFRCYDQVYCRKKYRNLNGLRYHYQHSDKHGQKGMAMLMNANHPPFNVEIPDAETVASSSSATPVEQQEDVLDEEKKRETSSSEDSSMPEDEIMGEFDFGQPSNLPQTASIPHYNSLHLHGTEGTRLLNGGSIRHKKSTRRYPEDFRRLDSVLAGESANGLEMQASSSDSGSLPSSNHLLQAIEYLARQEQVIDYGDYSQIYASSVPVHQPALQLPPDRMSPRNGLKALSARQTAPVQYSPYMPVTNQGNSGHLHYNHQSAYNAFQAVSHPVSFHNVERRNSF